MTSTTKMTEARVSVLTEARFSAIVEAINNHSDFFDPAYNSVHGGMLMIMGEEEAAEFATLLKVHHNEVYDADELAEVQNFLESYSDVNIFEDNFHDPATMRSWYLMYLDQTTAFGVHPYD